MTLFRLIFDEFTKCSQFALTSLPFQQVLEHGDYPLEVPEARHFLVRVPRLVLEPLAVLLHVQNRVCHERHRRDNLSAPPKKQTGTEETTPVPVLLFIPSLSRDSRPALSGHSTAQPAPHWCTKWYTGEPPRFLWSANCSFWFVPLRINKKPPWCDNRHGVFCLILCSCAHFCQSGRFSFCKSAKPPL